MKAEKKKLIMTLSVIITLNIFLLALSQYASADLYKKGASGAAVREIQTRLKSWGYYDGEVDGVYGSRTEKAVRYFQKKNGLPTGNSGGGSSSGGGSNSGNIDLLARLISAEARGEPYEGQVAVGAVVLNRVDHPSFPNTISGVIYQHEAFTCVYDGQFDQPVAESAYRAARDAMNGWDPSYGAIYYFNPATATSAWIWSRPEIVTIGRHKFCA